MSMLGTLSDVILPVWVKPLAVGLFMAATFGYGVHWGLRIGESKFIRYQQAVSEAASEQALATAKRIIRNNGIALKIETRLNRRLNDANKRLRQYATTDSGPVPALPESPRQPDAATANVVPLGEFNTLQGDYNKLYLDCTATTIIADEWQKRERELSKE